MGRLALLAVIGVAAVAFGGPAGCGSADDAVQSVRSQASDAASRALDGELRRAGAQVDALVEKAEARGIPAGRIRAQADRALALARTQADRAIAEAEQGDRDPGEVDRLRADAQGRLRALRARIDAALDGG